MHFILYIVVPHEIFDKGDKAIEQYISQTMMIYDENLRYIVIYKEDLEKVYNSTEGYKCIEEYIEEYCEKELQLEMDSNGNAISPYNDASIWDWYVIGGRWDGVLTKNRQCSDNGFNFGPQHHTIPNNSIKVVDFLKEYVVGDNTVIADHIIDTNGNLYQKDDQVDPIVWEEIFIDTLNKYPNDYIVNIDCHV